MDYKNNKINLSDQTVITNEVGFEPNLLEKPRNNSMPKKDRGLKGLDEGGLGLALSGGGFRASLFHIGVLARLAELDLLRRVAVLSTVSGGSIIGALYYLKIKELLEGRRPDKIKPGREVYQKIVCEIEEIFLAGVQKNVRNRILLNPFKNIKMLSADYSRSNRIAELYRDIFYLPVWKNITNNDAKEIYLHETEIHPLKEFLPESMQDDQQVNIEQYNNNPETNYKIPVLTINATTLNTGNLWNFTSTKVGEPGLVDKQVPIISSNRYFKQLEFNDQSLTTAQQERLKKITLAEAVAASASVPGLFPPFSIDSLYCRETGEEIVVQLVDGGVYDNQGLEALFSAGCSFIVCSDATGQMEDAVAQSGQALSVLMRSNSVLMDRIRNDAFKGLYLRNQGEKLLNSRQNIANDEVVLLNELKILLNVREFAYFHLKESFPATDDYPVLSGPVDKQGGLIYHLAHLRTDLDAFSDLEAYTLMYDGYSLCSDKLAKLSQMSQGLAFNQSRSDIWKFLKIRSVLEDEKGSERLIKSLQVGASPELKAFFLGEPIAYLIAALTAVIVAVLLWEIREWQFNITLWHLYFGLLLILLSTNDKLKYWLNSFKFIRKLLNGITSLLQWLLLPALVAAIISIPMAYHTIIFDRLFLRNGQLNKRR